MPKKEISALGYLILKRIDHKYSSFDSLPQANVKPGGEKIEQYIDNNAALKNKDDEIENEYTDYLVSGGTKNKKKWLDEDFYKTDNGKKIYDALDKVQSLFGVFGNQSSPDFTIKNQNTGSKIAGINPVWFILILLLLVSALIGLFIVAGKNKTKETLKKTAPEPAPIPVPAQTPVKNATPAEPIAAEF